MAFTPTYIVNDKVPVSITGSLTKSGKAADADATDRTIDATTAGGFNHIILDCSDCTAEMTFSVDEAISGAVKPIYIRNGMVFEAYLKGNILHYSGAGTFRYYLFN